MCGKLLAELGFASPVPGNVILSITASKILVHSSDQDELAALSVELRSEGLRAIDALSPTDTAIHRIAGVVNQTEFALSNLTNWFRFI